MLVSTEVCKQVHSHRSSSVCFAAGQLYFLHLQRRRKGNFFAATTESTLQRQDQLCSDRINLLFQRQNQLFSDRINFAATNSTSHRQIQICSDKINFAPTESTLQRQNQQQLQQRQKSRLQNLTPSPVTFAVFCFCNFAASSVQLQKPRGNVVAAKLPLVSTPAKLKVWAAMCKFSTANVHFASTESCNRKLRNDGSDSQ